jgi:hypothetical protein
VVQRWAVPFPAGGLKRFRKQLENVNLCHFSSCDLLHKYGSVSVPFPDIRAVEMIDSLAENFKTSFSDFRSHATNTLIFENPFSVEVSHTPEEMSLELSELQYDSVLCISFSQEVSVTFYASLPVSRFSELCKLTRSMQSALAYFCSSLTNISELRPVTFTLRILICDH